MSQSSKFYINSQKLLVREGKSLNTKILYTLPQSSVVENLHWTDDGRILIRIMSLKNDDGEDKWKNVAAQNLTGWISASDADGYLSPHSFSFCLDCSRNSYNLCQRIALSVLLHSTLHYTIY